MVIQLVNRIFSDRSMKTEVDSAADFLMNLLRVRQKVPVSDTQLRRFRVILAEALMERYQRHWYPEKPNKGSGFRCIRINGKMDPLVEQAGVAAGLTTRNLRKMLPNELTMWIDPDEVCYRIGENGSVCVHYDSNRASPTSDLDSKGSEGSEENLAESIGRIDISSDLKDYMLNIYEEDTTVITRPRNRSRHTRTRPAHHKLQNYHPSSNSNVQTFKISPCSSPAYHQQKYHHPNSNLLTPTKYDYYWDSSSVRSPC